MSASEKTLVSITLLGKSYQFRCPQHEVSYLQRASEKLSKMMQAVHEEGGVSGHSAIALLSALNLAHEHEKELQTKIKRTPRGPLSRSSVKTSEQLELEV